MSILLRISIHGNWPDELRRMFPRITLSQIEAFGALIKTDRLVDDAGEPTAELKAWAAEVTP